jgi:hypothetical protein
MGVEGQRHTPAALTPRKRPGTPCTECWVGPRTGLDGCKNSRPPPGFDPLTAQLVNESPYRLSYPGPQYQLCRRELN